MTLNPRRLTKLCLDILDILYIIEEDSSPTPADEFEEILQRTLKEIKAPIATMVDTANAMLLRELSDD